MVTADYSIRLAIRGLALNPPVLPLYKRSSGFSFITSGGAHIFSFIIFVGGWNELMSIENLSHTLNHCVNFGLYFLTAEETLNAIVKMAPWLMCIYFCCYNELL